VIECNLFNDWKLPVETGRKDPAVLAESLNDWGRLLFDEHEWEVAT
jgi:hypothetical protein